MLDLAIFPDLDALAADLAHATGKRMIVDVDALPDGFAQVTPISDQHPLTKIVVNQRFADLKYAIAGLYLAQQIKRAEHPEVIQRATANPRLLTSLHQAIVKGFGPALPGEKAKGLAQIFYDGIARQVTSVPHMLVAHRLFQQRCPSLRQAHDRFLGDLVALNLRFFQAPIDARYPASVVKSNQSLLGLETLGLHCLLARAESTTAAVDALVAAHPWLADKGLAQYLLLAIGPIGSLLHGDLDALDPKELTLLACRHGKVSEEWVDWTVPTGITTAPKTQMLPRDLLVDPDQDRHETAGEVAVVLAEGDREALLRLVDEGFGTNQDVLVALAEAELIEGKDEEEAMRVARLVIGLDGTTKQADRAAALINAIAASRTHKNFKFRPDIFFFLRDAYQTLTNLDTEVAKGVWMETAHVTAEGVSLDGDRKYALKSLPKRTFSGQHLTCMMFAGIHLFAGDKKDQMFEMLNLPYQAEWDFIFADEGKT